MVTFSVFVCLHVKISSKETLWSLQRTTQKFGFMEARGVAFPAIVSTLFSFCIAACVSGSLSFNFYGASCPSAEFIVRNTVRSFSSSDPSIPGKLLRLVFHDCFVEVSVSSTSFPFMQPLVLVQNAMFCCTEFASLFGYGYKWGGEWKMKNNSLTFILG